MNKTDNKDKYMTAYVKHKRSFLLALLTSLIVILVLVSIIFLAVALYEIINCTPDDHQTRSCLSRGVDYLYPILGFWGLLIFGVILVVPLYLLNISTAKTKHPVLNIMRKHPDLIVDCIALPDTSPLFAGSGLGVLIKPVDLLARKFIRQELYLLSLKVRTNGYQTKIMNIELLKDDAIKFAAEFSGKQLFRVVNPGKSEY